MTRFILEPNPNFLPTHPQNLSMDMNCYGLGKLIEYKLLSSQTRFSRLRFTLSIKDQTECFETTLWDIDRFLSGDWVFSTSLAAQATGFFTSKASMDFSDRFCKALQAAASEKTPIIGYIEEVFDPIPKASLWMVPMPIGKKEDLTPQAHYTLLNVDYILAEDRKVAIEQLAWRGVSQYKIHSCPAFREKILLAKCAQWIAEKKSFAFISDAGLPGLSDPGSQLLEWAMGQTIACYCLSGPSALLNSALYAQGSSEIEPRSWQFLGFPPKSIVALEAWIYRHAHHSLNYLTIFESPKRIARFMRLCADLFPHRILTLCKDLTKETQLTQSHSCVEWIDFLADLVFAGEFVLILHPEPKIETLINLESDARDRLQLLLRAGISRADLVKACRQHSTLKRNEIYLMLEGFKD